MYCDGVNGHRRVAKYFAVLYVAVPTVDTIGLKGKFSTVSFSFNLWGCAVPWYKPSLDDFGYVRL